MFGEPRASVLDFRSFDEVAPGLVSKKRERAKLSTIFEMDKDFARDAFLILKRKLRRKFRTVFDERLLRVGGFAMNETHETDQLVPGLPMGVAVFSGVNSGELPLVFSGERFDGLGQISREGFQFIGRALRRARLPEIGANVQILHAEASALTDGSVEVFGPREIVELRKMAREFGFIFARDRNVGAV